MQKIKFGILGVSNHFLKRIVLPLQASRNALSYAIASRELPKAEEAALAFDIPVTSDDYEALIYAQDVDAIYIPLPNHMHADWTIKALKAGKPVLCEKPLAMNTAQAELMVETAQSTGTPLMEAFMYRFHPLWQHVHNLIRTRQIGSLTYIHSAFSYNNPDPSNIRNIEEYGGGALMDIGCYAISVPRFLSDKEPQRVLALADRHPDFHTDQHQSALMDFGSFRASFHVSTSSQPFQKVDIVGTGGAITVHIPFNTYVDTPATISIATPQGSREVSFPSADPYQLIFEAFADAVLNKTAMPLSLEDALNNMRVIDAIRKSDAEQAWAATGL